MELSIRISPEFKDELQNYSDSLGIQVTALMSVSVFEYLVDNNKVTLNKELAKPYKGKTKLLLHPTEIVYNRLKQISLDNKISMNDIIILATASALNRYSLLVK